MELEKPRKSVARFKTNGSACGNVHTVSHRSLSISNDRGVGFCEMVVTPNLYRPVARICDFKRDGSPVLVQNDVARCREPPVSVEFCLQEIGL